MQIPPATARIDILLTLTIGGRFKGTIQANRVTLTSSAVVEGEIFHRLLAIEENAWFAGVSRPAEKYRRHLGDRSVDGSAVSYSACADRRKPSDQRLAR
jgi:cytoskeletal protein CcmA (bactofilin family)